MRRVKNTVSVISSSIHREFSYNGRLILENHVTMTLYHRFLTAHTCNTLHLGIQMVFVAWLAVGVLRLPPAQVGWVQCALLVPNILLLFKVGDWVDRSSPVRLLKWANALLAATHSLFLLSLSVLGLTLITLVVYAMVLGALNAVVQNARESLIGQLQAESGLQKTISTVTFIQFGGQAVGVAVAACTDWLGVERLVVLQLLLCAAAFGVYSKIRHLAQKSVSNAIVLSKVLRNTLLRLVVIVVAFNGFMHLGMFVVLLPLLAVNWLGYEVWHYAFLQLSFIVGSMAVSLRLMLGNHQARPGQHMVFALLYSGLIGFALAAGPTELGLYALIICWGAVAGSSANHCRVIVQHLAPEQSRGKVMAVYQMALFGTAPFGALLCGYLVQVGGINLPLKLIGYSSVGLFAVFFLLSKAVWDFQVADLNKPSVNSGSSDQA